MNQKHGVCTTVSFIEAVGTVLDSITHWDTQAVHSAQKLAWTSYTTHTQTVFRNKIKEILQKILLSNFFTCVSWHSPPHSQLTVWQIEDAVLKLKAGPRQRHLRCHNDGGGCGEEGEAFTVGLQSSCTTQSKKKKELLKSRRDLFPCRDNPKTVVAIACELLSK